MIWPSIGPLFQGRFDGQLHRTKIAAQGSGKLRQEKEFRAGPDANPAPGPGENVLDLAAGRSGFRMLLGMAEASMGGSEQRREVAG
ncbi:MAG: hypothetical protein WCA20_28325 [Candidatus Sulfotelmatobacter sp.]